MKPVIGILGAQLHQPDAHFIDSKIEYVQNVNIDTIVNAGGLPMVLPVAKNDLAQTAKLYVEHLDAVFFIGGEDSDPMLYSQQPDAALGEVDRQRDLFELAMYHAARTAKLPILGICRGLQLINIAEGGTLYQDLKLIANPVVKHNQLPTDVHAVTHDISIDEDNWLTPILGSTHLVNSVHHQAIDRLGAKLKAIAHSRDGVIEAIESDDHLVWGTQFHPEWLTESDEQMQAIFDRFVKQVPDL
ncbi:gamma-glutamyl-gamma-aminobutyrate hydrolase family protein [Paucilactobacillus sp. N302-9]